MMMHHWIRRAAHTLSLAGVAAMLLASPTMAKEMQAGTAETIQSQMKEAIKHAREAADAGKQGDAQAVVKHAKAALNKAKEAQSAGLNEYLNEGIHELGDVIEHANKKQIEDAHEHALHAIMRLSQAGGLQVPQDIHPEDRKAGS